MGNQIIYYIKAWALKLKTSYKVSIIVLLIIVGFGFLWQYPEFRFMITGKLTGSAETAANVTITGFIGDIIVTPPLLVNFTVAGSSGLQPGNSYNAKQNVFAYFTVNLNTTSNSPYDLYINASAMTGAVSGYTIPVANISVNTSCNDTGGEPYTMHRLSTSMIAICTGTVGQSVPIYSSANVYFYLDIPAGQYNDTYTGNIWLLANYSGVDSNSTWSGPNNSTGKVRTYIEASWNSTSSPISFGSLSPGSSSNATDETFPASLQSGAATNVFIDWYINGSNLISGSDSIGVGNLTYANATSNEYWPNGTLPLSLTLPDATTNGDFSNWGDVGNGSDTWVWFNISIPAGQQAGIYNGTLIGKAVEEGEDPTP